MQTTTIKIYSEDLRWWKMCCTIKGKNSQDCFREFRDQVKLKKQAVLYQTLPMPSDFKKKLEGKRIDKSKLALKVYK
jgi:hypothetical protein